MMKNNPEESGETKRSTFFGGAAILAASAVAVKVIGAVYRIPLGNILSDEVMGDYNSAYNIYNTFLTISTAGLPVALSKTISEENALGHRNQVQRIFKVAFFTFFFMGLFSFFCMTALAEPMARYVISNPKAVYCVIALAPSVLCVCIISSLRGFFQGHFDMKPTGVSQVIESGSKLIVGLALAIYFVKGLKKPEFGSVGAMIGVSFGSVVALLYMIFLYRRFRQSDSRIRSEETPDRPQVLLARLLRLAIPITIGSAATSLVTLIDTKLVMSQLQSVFQRMDGLAEPAALDAARKLYGIYSKTMSIYNLPFSMMMPLTSCIIPAVSAALTKGDGKASKLYAQSAFKIGMLVALPMGLGLFALGGPIMELLFPAIDVAVAGPLLSVLGLASVLVAVQLLCNSILQANNMVNLPILAVVIGGVCKVIVNYILVGNPSIRINGAPVGTLCCFLVIDILEIFMIKRAIRGFPSFLKTVSKPLFASVAMAAVAKIVYLLATSVLSLGSRLACLIAILCGVCVYFALILLLHALTKEDLSLMPKGDKIASVLRIRA